MTTIAFAEDEYSQAMVDFAAALRTRGLRIVRLLADSDAYVRAEPSRLRWEELSSRWVGDAVAADGSFTRHGWEVLDAESPVDLQAMEPIAMALSSSGEDVQRGWSKCATIPDAEAIDKWRLTAHLGAAGIAVPGSWDDVDAVPKDAGPLLCKRRDTGGGAGMMLCESKAEALAWRADLGAGETYLVQEFHDAPAVAVAGVAADGHALQAMAYRIRTNPRRPFGFGYGITVVEEPAAMDVAGQVLQLLGVRGPFALDLVPDAAGRWQVVDLNLRIWGSWTACQAAGMDVIGSYLAALGLGPQPKPTTARAGAQVPLLRTPPLDVSTPAQRMRWLRRDLRLIKQWSAWEGSDWAGLARRRAVGWAVKGAPLPS